MFNDAGFQFEEARADLFGFARASHGALLLLLSSLFGTRALVGGGGGFLRAHLFLDSVEFGEEDGELLVLFGGAHDDDDDDDDDLDGLFLIGR